MARKLRVAKGVLPFEHQHRKRGRVLTEQLRNDVVAYYNNDDISRMMPGKKDFLSVKQDSGTREHVQKRLLLRNIKELHAG